MRIMLERITKEIEETEDTITIGELISTMYYLKNKVDELETENTQLKEKIKRLTKSLQCYTHPVQKRNQTT